MMTRGLLFVLILIVPVIMSGQGGRIAPVVDKAPRVYGQASIGVSRFAIRFVPPADSSFNPWAYQICYGGAVGLEYPVKWSHLIPSVSIGFETHRTRHATFYNDWGVVQSGYHLQLGLNRPIHSRWKIGLFGWHRWINHRRTVDRSTPLDFSFFDKEWQGLSYSLSHTLRNRKLELIYGFSHGWKIAESSSYRINGQLHHKTEYRPIWMNFSGRYYL